jgi:hypothetical protein
MALFAGRSILVPRKSNRLGACRSRLDRVSTIGVCPIRNPSARGWTGRLIVDASRPAMAAITVAARTTSRPKAHPRAAPFPVASPGRASCPVRRSLVITWTARQNLSPCLAGCIWVQATRVMGILCSRVVLRTVSIATPCARLGLSAHQQHISSRAAQRSTEQQYSECQARRSQMGRGSVGGRASTVSCTLASPACLLDE